MHGSLVTAILWSLIPAIVLMAGIYYLDRYEKEPVRLIGIALGAGVIAAPLATAWIEKAFGVPNSVASSAVIVPGLQNANQPIIEELVLGAILVAVFFLVRYELDDVLDGLVYGGVVGVGFGMAANFWAIWTTPTLVGGISTHDLASTVLASFNWVFYAGVIGLLLGTARRAALGRVIAMAVVGTGIAMGFHLLHDYIPSWLAANPDDIQTSGMARFLSNLPNLLGLGEAPGEPGAPGRGPGRRRLGGRLQHDRRSVPAVLGPGRSDRQGPGDLAPPAPAVRARGGAGLPQAPRQVGPGHAGQAPDAGGVPAPDRGDQAGPRRRPGRGAGLVRALRSVRRLDRVAPGRSVR